MNNYFGIKNLTKKEGILFNSNMSDTEISFPDNAHQQLEKIEEESFWFQHRNNILKREILKLNIDKPFFDIGGGNGIVSIMLLQNGVIPVLIEPYLQGASNALRRGVENIICSDLSSLEFSEKIDYVGTFDVIEHIANDKEYISSIRNVLNDNATFIATVPALQSLWSNADVEAGHYKRYSRKELIKLFEKCDLKVNYCGYFFTYLAPLIYLLGRNDKNNQADVHQSDSEHKATGLKRLITNILNKLDYILIKVFKGKFFGSSLLIIAEKKTMP